MKVFICAFSVIGLALIEVIYSNAMSFFLDNPGFSTYGEDLANTNMEPHSQPSSDTSSSAPSFGGFFSSELPKVSWEDE